MSNKFNHPAQSTISDALVNSSNNLTILSWNIHDGMNGAEGLKADDSDFVDILTGCDVFCLQETKREFQIPNYKCYNQLRPDSRSGGLCIGIHRAMAEKVRLKEITTQHNDIQAISVTPNPGRPDDVYTIINVYDSPENSSYKAKKRGLAHESTLESLMNFLSITKHHLGNPILVGDFNARTGVMNHEHHDNPVDVEPQSLMSSHPTSTKRVSKDKVFNARGKHLIDLLACADLQLLNGNALGDIFGEFTCQNYNGASVVDYMAVSSKLKQDIFSFEIRDYTRFSDHRPLVCMLKATHTQSSPEEMLDLLEPAPVKYKWVAENRASHQQFIDAQLDEDFLRRGMGLSRTPCENEADVRQLNQGIIDLYTGVADKVMPKKPVRRATKNKRRNRMKPKSPWFDASCIQAKRELNRVASRYSRSPSDSATRIIFYSTPKAYRRLIKAKKEAFTEELSADIEAGRNVNWKRLNDLKKLRPKGTKLDVFDMKNFCSFFKELYAKPSLSEETITRMQSEIKPGLHAGDGLTESLDEVIAPEELEKAIKSLKAGKAVAEDLIANEFLKATTGNTLETLLHLYNECLRLGIYPWNTSLVTPLHKKGSVYDPNNYRAIAVASNLGKLFSTILLQRLIAFRAVHCPDTPNQLGFCKNAQTADHILTLTTCIDKQVNHCKKRLYTCFVDYAKAFDTVCREALLFKLWKLGINGRFFKCLEFMYSNSTAKIKLLGKLSDKIDILTGTEQGHPMSPELFKCYIHELSEILNSIEGIEVPILNGVAVSHLFWADDLVLLALNPLSLQLMLDKLNEYCLEWGLSVNISKTAVMVFNRAGRLLKESHCFTLGSASVPSTRSYCYLGIIFSLNGTSAAAQKNLRQKGMRAYFSIKSTINIAKLKKTVIFKLLDALISPVVGYGCQIWLPETWLFRALLDQAQGSKMTDIAKDPLEKLHLSILKWTLGVNKKTSNSAVWGDSGRVPLCVTLLKQTLDYVNRLQKLNEDDAGCFVRHAYAEQASLNLKWHANISAMQSILKERSTRPGREALSPLACRQELTNWFTEHWESERRTNKKLAFYNSIKPSFYTEPYLKASITHQQTKRTAQLRTSSHQYNVETGRYAKNRSNPLGKICRHCTTPDDDTLLALAELPSFDPIIEDEVHILRTCPLYYDLRMALDEQIKEMIFRDVGEIFSAEKIMNSSRYILKIFKRRFPKNQK